VDRGGWTVDDLRRYVDAALEIFGSDRLLFGSDWPVCQLAS
jgi:L-fuconolactonase